MISLRARCAAGILALAFLLAHGDAGAMTARQVIDRAVDRYMESIQGIDDYTIVTENFVIYNLKEEVDGRPVFRTKTEVKDAFDPAAGISASTLNYYGIFDADTLDYLRERASYEGTDEVEGHRVHVIKVAEFDMKDRPGGEEVKAENVRIYIDADRWVVRKQTFDSEFEHEGETRSISPEILLGDYRDVEGLLIPYRTRVAVPGLHDSVTEEEMEEARRGMEEFEKQLEQLPEAQRQMVESHLRPRMEKLLEVLESGTFTAEVKEVRVNTGLSGDIFD